MSKHTIFYTILILIIVFLGIWGYQEHRGKIFLQNEILRIQAELEKDFTKESQSISGNIKELSQDGSSLKMVSGSDGSLVAVNLDKNTKIYRLSNEDAPQKISLNFSDLKIDQFVTVMSNESVKDKNTIYAEEIFVF